MQINFEKFDVNEAERKITFSCASDYPYMRFDEEHQIEYEQILVINENSVDFSRLNTGNSPLLFNHDTDKLLGIVNKAYIIENKIFVQVQFSKNDEFADRIYKDILDGTIKGVSIGYQIDAYTDKQENGINRRYVDKFLIYEVSIVSIPADPKVGFRNFNIIKKDDNFMEDKVVKQDVQQVVENTPTENIEQKPIEQKACGEEQVEVKACGEDEEVKKLRAENEELKCKIKALEDEKVQVVEQEEKPLDDTARQQIQKIGQDFHIAKEEIERAIEEKITVREFKDKIKNLNFNVKNKENKIMDSKREFKEFLETREFDKPFNFRSFSGFGGLTGQGGESLIGTETLPLVQILEKKLGVKGYRVLSGLTSNITIPVQTTRNVAYATDHLRDAATESNPGFTPVTLTPTKISGNCTIGKELLTQVNDDVIAFVIDSLLKEISYKIEDYMLGKVVAANPTEINYSALASIDFDDILAFEAAVAGYNLDPAAMSFVMSPAARAVLKGVPLVSSYPKFLCENNEINGYRAEVSGCVSNNNIYFGDWSKLILAIWDKGAGMEVIIDPYTQAKQGNVVVVASMCIDAAVEQVGAFALGKVQDSSTSSESSASL